LKVFKHVFEYLRFNFKTQEFVTRLPIKAHYYENVKCVRIIKCVKVRALFVQNKVRFARAEQLWYRQSRISLVIRKLQKSINQRVN